MRGARRARGERERCVERARARAARRRAAPAPHASTKVTQSLCHLHVCCSPRSYFPGYIGLFVPNDVLTFPSLSCIQGQLSVLPRLRFRLNSSKSLTISEDSHPC